MPEQMFVTTRIALAFIYCLLGLSGYFVLTTPTYGTAVFPASGFALAAMIHYGRKNVVLSVAAGSVLLQFALGFYLSHSIELGKIGLYALIGSGAALQAWIGHELASIFLGKEKYAKLENSYDSIKFFILTGCIATTVSATVGNISLWVYGVLDTSEFFYNWVSWYIGDTLGVIACYPIFISFFTRQNDLWSYRRLRIWAPSLVMLAVLVGGIHGFNNWSIQEQKNRLSADGYAIREKIVENLGSHEAVLVALANFVEASFDPVQNSINYNRFKSFSDRFLETHKNIHALSINDIVINGERESFEEMISSSSPLGKYEITERNAQKELIRASQRDTYVPVRYINPLQGNQPAVGFDILSESKRRTAIERALALKQMSVTAPIKLVQDADTHVGVLQLMPIMKGRDKTGAEPTVIGFAVAVLKVDALLHQALEDKIPTGLKVEILDLDAPDGESLLYQSGVDEHPIINRSAGIDSWSTYISLGGEVWTIRVTPIDSRYLNTYSLQFQMLIIFAGIMLFLLGQVFLLDITGSGFVSDQKIKESLHTLQKMVDRLVTDSGSTADAYYDLRSLSKLISDLIIDNKNHIDQLEKSSQAKTIFLTTMSHEIRTPLNALLGTVQVLNRTHLTQDQYGMVRDIDYSGQLLLSLLNDILDFSKIEAGKMEIHRVPFDLYSLLSDLKNSLNSLASSKGLLLKIEEPQQIEHWLIGDHLRLIQVLSNLVGNAIKFTNQGSVTLKVIGLPTTALEQQVVRFEVCDTGIGIDNRRFSDLFSPFTQGDGSMTRQYGGTGLGLSICKKLIDLMDGKIGVVSQLHEGSTFWVEIPYGLGQSHQPEKKAALSQPPAPLSHVMALQGNHILVVDDNEMNRIMLMRLLSQEGATDIHMAENGQLAIEIIEKNPNYFDAVFMDVQMPVMDGLTATRFIRDNLGLTNLPILICSAGVYLEEQGKAFDAGANDFIPKPIQREVMLNKLKAAMAAKPAIPEPEPSVATIQKNPPSHWPTIDGIDVEAVKEQVGDDPDFFFSMLEMFTDNLRSTIAELPQQTGPEQRGAQMLHKLRGSAGTMGATALMASSRELEDAIKQQSPDRDVLLQHFLQQMQTLLQAITAATQRHQDTPQ